MKPNMFTHATCLKTELVDAAAPEALQSTTETPTKLPRVLVHTRDADDKKVLTDNFDLTKVGRPVYISGLMTDAQLKMVKAAAQGVRIVSTGLPLDLAANLGKITIIRAWDKTRKDGTRTQGSTPPADYYAGRIIDSEAFEALKDSPLFVKAFHKADLDDEAEDEEGI